MLNGAVEVLKEIGKKLGKKDWDFGVDPCSGEGGNWRVWDGRKSFESNVTCDCTFNHNSSCHVVSMYSSLFLFPHSICSLLMFFPNKILAHKLWRNYIYHYFDYI